LDKTVQAASLAANPWFQVDITTGFFTAAPLSKNPKALAI
jgi:hypothetical protein